MKKMLLAAVLFGLSHLSFAQTKTSGTPKMRWGVKSGFIGSYTSNGLGVDPNVFKSPGIRATVYLGLYYQLSLAEKLTLQQELVYSPEGSLQEGKLGANNTFVLINTLKLNYLNVPLMLQYGGSSGVYIEAGPQIGFLTSAKNRFANPPSGPASETNISSEFNRTNFSVAAGLGYNAKNGFGFSARYVHGLSNVHKVTPEMKLTTIQIGTHYRFGK